MFSASSMPFFGPTRGSPNLKISTRSTTGMAVRFISPLDLEMAARQRLPRHPEEFHDFRDGPRRALHRGPGPFPIHPAALEEELEIQHRDMQKILSENRHMMDENLILQRELAAAKDEIQSLGQVIPKLRTDREAQARELIDRRLKLEVELRSAEPLWKEVMQLRAEAQKLNGLRHDLSAQVQMLTNDINQAKAENKQADSLKADVDGLQKELMEARRAFEYEKKSKEEQLEQKQAMEKNLVSMAREIEKLRAEHLNGDRRSHGLGAGGYGMLNGSLEMRYAGGTYGNMYGGGAIGPYDKRGPARR